MSEDIEARKSCFILFRFGVGYHQDVVTDIPLMSLVDERPLNIPHIKAIHLRICVPKDRYRHKIICESQMLSHKILPLTHQFYSGTSYPLGDNWGRLLGKSNASRRDILLGDDYHCQKLCM